MTGQMAQGGERVGNEEMAYVLHRLREALRTLGRLPPPYRTGRMTSWPDVVRSYWDAYGYSDPAPPRIVPTARQISQMDEALGWLAWLAAEHGADTARIVWAAACGYGVRKIARAAPGLGKSAVQERKIKGLYVLAARYVKK